MYNSLLFSIFSTILDSLLLIKRRFSKINSPKDFVNTPDGIDILDSIAMRLQVIGEELKAIDKIDADFLNKYNEIEWNRIKALRDIISHHYSEINVDIIYDVCTTKLNPLEKIIRKILKDLESSL